MSLVDRTHPFYKPLWRRIAIVATTAAWAGFELIYVGSSFWALIAVAACAYSFATFILTWKDEDESTK